MKPPFANLRAIRFGLIAALLSPPTAHAQGRLLDDFAALSVVSASYPLTSIDPPATQPAMSLVADAVRGPAL